MKRGGPLKRYAPIRPTKMRAKAPRRLTRAKNDTAYRDWVRTLPCVVCGRYDLAGGNQPAHMTLGANQKGVGIKTHDRQVVPMCNDCHENWDRHEGQFKGWPKERRWAQARAWVSTVQLAATPEHYDHAVSLERLGLGRIARGGAGWHWEPGPVFDVERAREQLRIARGKR